MPQQKEVTLLVNVDADSDVFTAEVKDAGKEHDKFTDKLKKNTQKAIQYFDKFAKSAAVAVGALAFLAKRSLDATTDLNHFANAAEVSVEAMQGLQYIFEAYSVDSQKAFDATQRMTIQLGELGKETSELRSSLEQLDPTLLRQLESVENNDQAWRHLITAVQGYATNAQAAAILKPFFGEESAAKVAHIFRDVGLSLEEIVELTKDKVGIITTEEAQAAADAAQAVSDLANKMRTAFDRVVAQNAGKIQEAAERLAEAMPDIVDLFSQLASVSLDDILDKMKKLVGVASGAAAARVAALFTGNPAIIAATFFGTAAVGGAANFLAGNQGVARYGSPFQPQREDEYDPASFSAQLRRIAPPLQAPPPGRGSNAGGGGEGQEDEADRVLIQTIEDLPEQIVKSWENSFGQVVNQIGYGGLRAEAPGTYLRNLPDSDLWDNMVAAMPEYNAQAQKSLEIWEHSVEVLADQNARMEELRQREQTFFIETQYGWQNLFDTILSGTGDIGSAVKSLFDNILRSYQQQAITGPASNFLANLTSKFLSAGTPQSAFGAFLGGQFSSSPSNIFNIGTDLSGNQLGSIINSVYQAQQPGGPLAGRLFSTRTQFGG